MTTITRMPVSNKIEVDLGIGPILKTSDFDPSKYQRKEISSFNTVLQKEITHSVLIINGEQVSSLFLNCGIYDVDNNGWRKYKIQ